MKLSQLLYGTSLVLEEVPPELEILDISKDSRTLSEGMLFVALSQEPEQRHLHCLEAIQKGAVLILCPKEDKIHSYPSGIYSENPRYDYALLVGNYFGNPSRHCILIGVTGTNGKTTTTHLIKEVLEHSKKKVGLIGTNENKIAETTLPSIQNPQSPSTTPDAYELQQLFHEMLAQGCTHIVMEVSSHALVQHRCGGLEFTVGIFTNLTQDHLDYHGNMDCYQQAKAQLFAQSKLSIFNLDDPVGRDFAQHHKHSLSYSENKNYATLYSEKLHLHPNSISFHCVHDREQFPVSLAIPGGFSLYNALAALCCAVALDIPLQQATASFSQVQGVKGRAEIVPTDSEFTVMIDYAHSPNALENILLSAKNFTQGRLICLFGCGGNRDKSKRPIMGEIAEDIADIVIVTSDNPRWEEPDEIISDILSGMWQDKERQVIPNRKEAIFYALSQGRSGDVIVLAGKGHECYQEIHGETLHLDEREIVQEFFDSKQH